VLAPCREETTLALVVNNTNLLSMSRFLVEIEREDAVYTLLSRGNSMAEEVLNLPTEVQ